MRCHLGIGSIDLRLVQTGFDDGDLGIIGYEKTWHTRSPQRRAYAPRLRARARPDPTTRQGPHRTRLMQARADRTHRWRVALRSTVEHAVLAEGRATGCGLRVPARGARRG